MNDNDLGEIMATSEHAAFDACQKVEEGDFLKLTGSIMFHVQMIDHRHRRPLDYFDVVYARRCIETPKGVEYLGSTEKLTVTYDPPNNPVVRIERRARIIRGVKKEGGVKS